MSGIACGIDEPIGANDDDACLLLRHPVDQGAAGVAYAAWQTLRADDSLWVEDEPETDEA